MAISSAIVSVLTNIQECQCPINEYYLRDAILMCSMEPNDVIFRARLFSTPEATITQLLMFLEDWVSIGPTISINGENLAVQSSCPVVIQSFNETGCPPSVAEEPESFNYSLVYIIVGVVGGVMVTVLLLIIALCCCCYRRKISTKKQEYSVR